MEAFSGPLLDDRAADAGFAGVVMIVQRSPIGAAHKMNDIRTHACTLERALSLRRD
jgi:hypothetical protein